MDSKDRKAGMPGHVAVSKQKRTGLKCVSCISKFLLILLIVPFFAILRR